MWIASAPAYALCADPITLAERLARPLMASIGIDVGIVAKAQFDWVDIEAMR